MTIDERRFTRMRDTIKESFPLATEKEIIHARNLISNQLRRLKVDIYEVCIHTHSMDQDPGYHTNFEIVFGDQRQFVAHVKVTVD